MPERRASPPGAAHGRWLVLLALLATWPSACARPAGDHAVVLVYHHVAADTPPSTSVTVQRFEAHLEHLADNGYRVWHLPRILAHLRAGEPVPGDVVALTFDDAYVSVYENAFPRLRERGWPFTVFVSTDYIDRGYGNYMSWAQLRELGAAGVAIGNHSRSHAHLVRRLAGEDEAEWRERVRGEILDAQARLSAETGAAVRIFAYPYGEYDAALEGLVEALGFFGVGQQSGVAGPDTALTAVPRFPVASGYDDLETLGLRLRARPLPVRVLAPARRVLGPGDPERPVLRLALEGEGYRAGDLACYASGQGRMRVRWIDEGAREVAVEPEHALAPGRSKYNCTAPSARESGVFYWYSHLWMKKNPDGSWYGE